MPAPGPRATVEEIHAHLVERTNLALRRIMIYGGESVLRMMIDHLLFVERRPEELTRQQREWETRGVWTCRGVVGAFREVLPGQDEQYAASSVYAEFAHRCGWLEPDRVLTEDEYAALTGRARAWAREDRTWPEVTAEFGPPSVLVGGTNPLYGKTLGYLGADPRLPMVSFHLGNGEAGQWPPPYEQPLLLAVRFGEGPFLESFTFTPEGERRRPVPESDES
ncbi:hypothetical protein ACIHEI_32340 [Kitasatospora sp. NPDC051984]|uniref:hypothetical protein n=1 Tax=Kitasatospora sp. NPDC051984 TaxID=3364059 RepID=UPI0037C6AA61